MHDKYIKAYRADFINKELIFEVANDISDEGSTICLLMC